MTTETPTIAFLDTETTGLDPVRHEVWEVGLILRKPDPDGGWQADEEYLWQLPVDLSEADLIGLNVGRFKERRWEGITDDVVGGIWPADGTGNGAELPLDTWAEVFMDLTWGAHIVGAVPDFDSRRLGDLLLRHGALPAWHYHLVCAEVLAAGKLGMLPPWRSDDLAFALGVEVSEEDRHTALGDARMARAMYDAVYAEALRLDHSHLGPGALG